MDVFIRQAGVNDSKILTEISFAAKKYWNYPNQYFDVWKEELTITPAYIENNKVYVAEVNGKIVGYFSIVEVRTDFWAGKVFVNKGFWLEHIFILPEYIGKSIGTKLVDVLKIKCSEKNIDTIHIFSDPNAKGFYDKLGADYLGESPSSIEGRTVGRYELPIK